MKYDGKTGYVIAGLVVIAIIANVIKGPSGPSLEELRKEQEKEVVEAEPAAPNMWERKTTNMPVKGVPYELIVTEYGSDLPFLAAVISSIDPAKDDYKAYCRYIVNEVAKKYTGFALTIYDSKEAERLYDVNFRKGPLTKVQHAIVNEHVICLYSKGLGPDTDNDLWYYPNGYGTQVQKYLAHETYFQ